MTSIYNNPEYQRRVQKTVAAQQMIQALLFQQAEGKRNQKTKQSNPASDIASQLIKSQARKPLMSMISGEGGAISDAIPSWAGGPTAPPMTSIEGALATTPEANAAFNAPGMAATEAAKTPFFSLNSGGLLGEGPMPTGNYLPGIAGTYGMYDLLKNKKHGAKGAKQGAVSGAGIGYTVGGLPGAGIGAVIGGTAGYFGNFGDNNRFQDEAERAELLRAQGIPWNYNMQMPTKGRSKEELIQEALAAGRDPTFARTRDESALSPVDITGYAAFGEKLGGDYSRASQAIKEAIAQRALQNKAVREHHGTIDVNWTPELEEFAKQQLGGAK